MGGEVPFWVPIAKVLVIHDRAAVHGGRFGLRSEGLLDVLIAVVLKCDDRR